MRPQNLHCGKPYVKVLAGREFIIKNRKDMINFLRIWDRLIENRRKCGRKEPKKKPMKIKIRKEK